MEMTPERCEALAQKAYDGCKAAGGTEDRCAALKADILEKCGAITHDPPEPPAPATCEERCDARFADALAHCGDEEACKAEIQGRIDRCKADCGVADCRSACSQAYEAATKACMALPRRERDACMHEARAQLEACQRTCMPQSPRDCLAACKAKAEEAVKDFTGTDEEKAAAYEEAFKACAASCPGVPQPPPTCSDRCVAAADKLFPCAEGDVECAAKKAEFLAICQQGCEALPPESCVDRCALRQFEVLMHCVREGGADCLAKAKTAYDACAAACENPPAPRPTCEQTCRAAYEETVATTCTTENEDGTTVVDPDCVLAARKALVDCTLANCVRPLAPACDEVCAGHAEKYLAKCIEEGGDPAECLTKATEKLEGCLERCDFRPHPCAENCREAARSILESCLADPSSDAATCQALAETALAKCMRRCDAPFPPGCDARGAKLAESFTAVCGELGGGAEACAAYAAKLAEYFAIGCPPPERVPCADKCAKASEALLAFLAKHEVAEAQAIAGVFEAGCLVGCDHPKPRSCADGCEYLAEKALAECVAGGGTEDECKVKVDEILKACLIRCVHRVPACADECAAGVRTAYAECVAGITDEAIAAVVEASKDDLGNPTKTPAQAKAKLQRQCKLAANEALVTCIEENCPKVTPPTCGDRCTAGAAKVKEICEKMGGTAEQCGVLVAEFGALCEKHCAGERLSPCDVQCDEIAAKMKAACAEGDTACVEAADAFALKCKDTLGVICDREAADDSAPPRKFRRGDVNRDRKVDLSDCIETLSGLFQGKAGALDCENAADMNADGEIDISDAIQGLRYLFMGGTKLPPPNDEGYEEAITALMCMR